MERYSVYLMDLETFNVYDDPIYTNDLEEAKKLAIDMVLNAKFDENPDFQTNAFIVSIDDNNYQMTKDWQILSYGLLPYEEVKDIAGQDFNGYTQLDKIYENILNGISKGISKALNENITPLRPYSFYNTCNNMDADEVQDITKWDEYCDNEYCISDYAYDKVIHVISYKEFKNKVEGEYQPSEEDIEYCAYNSDLDIIFCLDIDGIHWFYE